MSVRDVNSAGAVQEYDNDFSLRQSASIEKQKRAKGIGT